MQPSTVFQARDGWEFYASAQQREAVPDDMNDNHSTSAIVMEPAAYGQAAYFLVESLIHVLVEQAAMTRTAAIEVADVACDVRLEIAHHADDASLATMGSIELLRNLAKTLRADQTD